MATETVRVRAHRRNLPQIGLRFGEEGDVPTDAAQPFIDRGLVAVVNEPKPKKRSAKPDTEVDGSTVTPETVNEGDAGE